MAGIRRTEGDSETYPDLNLFIGGDWSAGSSGRTIPVVDPGTGEAFANLPFAAPGDVDAAADAAGAAFGSWRETPAFERAGILRAAAAILRDEQESLARNNTRESGKPLHESRGEVAIAADTLDWFAGEAQRTNGELLPARRHGNEFRVELLPVGPVAAFCAWNAPLANPVRKIAPALAAGCTAVLKASEETPAGALAPAPAPASAGPPGPPSTPSAPLVSPPPPVPL